VRILLVDNAGDGRKPLHTNDNGERAT